jgi:hypothetical protein
MNYFQSAKCIGFKECLQKSRFTFFINNCDLCSLAIICESSSWTSTNAPDVANKRPNIQPQRDAHTQCTELASLKSAQGHDKADALPLQHGAKIFFMQLRLHAVLHWRFVSFCRVVTIIQIDLTQSAGRGVFLTKVNSRLLGSKLWRN